MPRVQFRHFTSIEFLQRIDKPKYLRPLFNQWSEFFRKNNLNISRLRNGNATDQRILKVFTRPENGMPVEMIEVLNMLEELATADERDRIREQAADQRITITGLHDRMSAGEFVIHVWLQHPQLVHWCHDAGWHRGLKNFHEFQGRVRKDLALESALCAAETLEERLSEFFDKTQRSEACHIFVHADREGSEIIFSITHGKLFRRDGRINNNLARDAIAWRPQKHDVVIYDNVANILQVNAETPPIRNEYVNAFGDVLFGTEEFFPRDAVYSLDHLPNLVRTGLLLVTGVKRARVSEIRVRPAVLPGVTTTWHAEGDQCLLQLAKDKGSPDLSGGRVLAVSMMVTYKTSNRPRKVEIRWPNVAKYDRQQNLTSTEKLLHANGFYANGASREQRRAN